MTRKITDNNEKQLSGNIDELAMFWDTTDFFMKLLKAEWEVNQQEGGEEFKRHTIWQNGGFVAPSWAAEDREGWRHWERMSNACRTAEDYTDDDEAPPWAWSVADPCQHDTHPRVLPHRIS